MSKVVALEVAPQALRAAEVSGYKGKNPRLLRTGELKLNEELQVAGDSAVYNPEAFGEALQQLWIDSGFSTRTVALLLSGKRFIVRPHLTSQTSMSNLRKVLRFEAAGAFPEQSEELLFDFYPTHAYEDRAGTQTEGLVISTPAEPVLDLAMALKGAKLDLEYVDFTPLAVTRWIRRNRPEQNYALVNIRDESTDITVVEDGMPRMIRVVPKGLSTARRRLDRGENQSSPLLRRDILGENGVRVLVQEIGLTVTTQSDEIASDLECIFTSGPRAADPELRAVIGELFNLPVEPLFIESLVGHEDLENNRIPSFDDFVAMTGGIR